jgi:hypothetical protein
VTIYFPQLLLYCTSKISIWEVPKLHHHKPLPWIPSEIIFSFFKNFYVICPFQNTNMPWYVRLPWLWILRLWSSGMWFHAVWWKGTRIFLEHPAFIFNAWNVAAGTSTMLGPIYQITWCHIQADCKPINVPSLIWYSRVYVQIPAI